MVVDGWVVVIWLAIFVEVAAAMAASAAVATAATVTRISGCILTFLAEGAVAACLVAVSSGRGEW